MQHIEMGVSRNEKEIQSYGWLLKSTLLKNDRQALSLNAKILYYELYASYYNYIEDSEKCYEFSKKLYGSPQDNFYGSLSTVKD